MSSQTLSVAFHNKVQAGATPIQYISIATDAGLRLFADKQLGANFETGRFFYNGEFLSDGFLTYGSSNETVSREPFLQSIGDMTRSISGSGQAISKASAQKRQGNVKINMNDPNKTLVQRLTSEPLISKLLTVFYGFDDIAAADHLTMFEGTINRVRVTETTIQLQVLET